MKNAYEIREEHVAIILKHKGEVLEALVDIEDLPALIDYPHTWHAIQKGKIYYVRGHMPGCGTTNKIYLHHFLLNPPEGYEIDHINHNGVDNRRANLRIVTRAENRQNSIAFGVSKHGDKYRGRMQIGGQRISLGLFDTAEDAHQKVKEARDKLSPLSMEAVSRYKPGWIEIKAWITMEHYEKLDEAAEANNCTIDNLIREAIEAKTYRKVFGG